jgi:2'-5' RNA ligase
MRTFLAIEIPGHIRRRIDKFIQEEAKIDLPVKWVKFENLHITLKFLGEIDERKKKEIMPIMKEISKDFTVFKLNLGGLGCFPNPKNPRILWIGVEEGSEKLCKIASQLEEKLAQFGFKKEKRFHPHLTIGRIKKYCRIDDILQKNLVTEIFLVNSITLFKSTLTPKGPIYDELEKFVLSHTS